MEECISLELGFLIDELGRKGRDPFDIQDLLTQSVSNVATKIVFGSRFDYTAEQLENLQFDEFVEKGLMMLRMPILEVITAVSSSKRMTYRFYYSILILQ